MPPTSRKVALVTGGAVHVGRVLSLGLAAAGYDVVVHDRAAAAAAREVRRRIGALGRQALVVGGDLDEADGAADITRAVSGRFGRLDLLVNSGPACASHEPDAPRAPGRLGPFLLVRETAALLADSRGAVINVVDPTEAALLHLTRTLARAMAPHVRVNAVVPSLLPADVPGARVRGRARPGRRVPPEEVLRTVLFLAGAPFISGEALVVGGGLLPH